MDEACLASYVPGDRSRPGVCAFYVCGVFWEAEGSAQSFHAGNRVLVAAAKMIVACTGLCTIH